MQPRNHSLIQTQRRTTAAQGWIARLALTTLLLFSVSITPPRANAAAKAHPSAGSLVYLDEQTLFHPDAHFPRLTTPQWVGEEGVDAVIVLSIDDMRSTEAYETFLRPVLDRIKTIEGRAALSIFCNAIDPANPRLQEWLREGLSFEVHTLAHPCPLLQKGNFQAAADNYFGGIELLNKIPGNRPVAFRMPCCDSMSSPSPRFFHELFPRPNALGQSLVLDSSVMNVITTNDPSVPRDWILDATGANRFAKYLPMQTNAQVRTSMDGFQTLIEDYPYPYLLPGGGWEIPCVIPSDWEAQNAHGPNQPVTVADWKRVLDITVLKQGVFSLIFHPHGWIRPDQLVEFIDDAVTRHGKRIRFLNLREVAERLERHALGGTPLRNSHGGENGVRLLDLDQDGRMDVVIGNEEVRKTRVWRDNPGRWEECAFPVSLAGAAPPRFGRPEEPGRPVLLVLNEQGRSAWQFDGKNWAPTPRFLRGLEVESSPLLGSTNGIDLGLRFRDLDRDGHDELLVSNPAQSACWRWNLEAQRWDPLSFAIPKATPLVDLRGRAGALQFADLNGDGYPDLLYSDPERVSIDLFIAVPKANLGWERGWTFNIHRGDRVGGAPLPPFVRAGEFRNNGIWFREGHLWAQNEDTAHLPAKVDRRSFASLLRAGEAAPKSVQEALASFRLAEAFTIECVAQEPLVVDPVSMAWDERGRLWVAEMRDYPLGMDGKGQPGGVVKILEDTDGDGVFDKASIFLEGLRFPNSVTAWRGGALITAAPDVIYAEDTDGDGRADKRMTLITGFVEGNQQHRVNGFELGLDGWVYLANGDSGGHVRSVLTGEGVELRGQDLRFDPDTGRMEGIEGQTQFGRRRDDWGNWFGNNNPNWLWHYYFPRGAAGRNPAAPVGGLQRMTPKEKDPMRVFVEAKPQRRMNWPGAENQVTSANSPTPYRDDLFGPDFAQSVFISEPANNVVHREVLAEAGVSFTSLRAESEKNREFLASTDTWFRPTTTRVGPDGALYVADMYRKVIEHPEYFPDELKKRSDLRDGEDRGRIYRIAPKNAPRRKSAPFVTNSAVEIASRLGSPSGWERDTAMRLLMHDTRRTALGPAAARQPDAAALKIVRSLATTHNEAKVRLQAFHTLATLDSAPHGVLSLEDLAVTLKDPHPALRSAAVKLLDQVIATSSSDSRVLIHQAAALAHDPSIKVRFQLALSLGRWPQAEAGAALAQLASGAESNPDLIAAIKTSTAAHLETFWRSLPPAQQSTWQTHAAHTAIAANKSSLLTMLAVPQDGLEDRAIFLAMVCDGVDRFAGDWTTWWNSAGRPVQNLLLERSKWPVESVVLDRNLPEEQRLLALQCLGRPPMTPPFAAERWAELLSPSNPPSLRKAAMRRLQRLDSMEVAAALLHGWAGFGAEEQTEIARMFAERTPWTPQFLDALEQGRIPRNHFSPEIRQRLQRSNASGIRERLARFSSAEGVSKSAAELSRTVAELEGRPSHGAPLFKTLCGVCHRLRGEGITVGPDLGTMADKPGDSILVAIVDPNAAVDARYAAFDVHTRDGRDVGGILQNETASTVTLRQSGGIEQVLPRVQIDSIRKSSLSLMPEGFGSTLTPQQLADVVAFIRSP